MARPTDYSEDLALSICESIAEGQTVRAVCAEDGMPDKATIFRWLAKHEAFRDQYAHAKEMQTDSMAEELLDIADDGTNDYIERKNKDGSAYEAVNGENIQRSRLRVDTRKWLMSKMKAKKYGDKLGLDHGGSIAVSFTPVDDDI